RLPVLISRSLSRSQGPPWERDNARLPPRSDADGLARAPADGRCEANHAMNREEGRPAPKPRILIADDNRDGADSLARFLKLSGYDAHQAHDGEEAIVLVASLRPDIALLDIGMPKQNGHDVARHIRQQSWGK